MVRELGRGGMGCVYEAVHVQHNNRVALKTLPEADGERLHQFKREFRSLANPKIAVLSGRCYEPRVRALQSTG